MGLHYPHTWPTIKKGVQQTFLYNLGAGLKDETAILKEVYYPSPEQLIKALNASMSKEAQAKIKFSYNPSSRKVTVDVKRGSTIWFTGDIAAVLGFAQDCFIEKKTSSPYTADINSGFSSLYVYTDIVAIKFYRDAISIVTSHFNDRTCPSSYLYRCATPMTLCIYYEVILVHSAPLEPIVTSLVGIL